MGRVPWGCFGWLPTLTARAALRMASLLPDAARDGAARLWPPCHHRERTIVYAARGRGTEGFSAYVGRRGHSGHSSAKNAPSGGGQKACRARGLRPVSRYGIPCRRRGRHWAARTAFRSDGSANAVYPDSYSTNRNRTIVNNRYTTIESRTGPESRPDDIAARRDNAVYRVVHRRLSTAQSRVCTDRRRQQGRLPLLWRSQVE